MYDNLLMLESPIQIAIVLLIALVVFGPKRLPEIGKQIGSALRELRKATGDVMHSMNTDYEPDPEPYTPTTTTEYEPSYYSRPTSLPAPVDLTDYTIVGALPTDPTAATTPAPDPGDAYRIAPSSEPAHAQPEHAGSPGP